MFDFPRPSDRKQVQSFLGIAGYFRRYIPIYGNISSVLSELLKKGKIFQWTEECEKEFLALKSCLAFGPVLRPPNYQLPFSLVTDASDRAVGSCIF